jgi:hypothetical protein
LLLKAHCPPDQRNYLRRARALKAFENRGLLF